MLFGMAPSSADAAAPLYGFEQLVDGSASRRDPQLARAELLVLWKRLDGDEVDLAALEKHDPDSWGFLLRYVTDGPLCIKWYEGERPRLERKHARYNWLV